MEFKICQDSTECKKLWNSFSSSERLFDLWEFRICFYDDNEQTPHFIAGYDKEKLIGVLPLCFVISQGIYTYFGGWFPERNKFFLKDKQHLQKFLEQVPKNTLIEGIDSSEGQFYNFLEDEYTYFLDLKRFGNDFEKYFSSFDKKKQKNITRDIKSIPKYNLFRNRTKDFARLVELNRMQHEDDSKFNDDAIAKGIQKLIEFAKKKKALDLISVEINGKTEAVDLGIIYNKWYYSLIGGVNTRKIPNLGKLMIILDIKAAIEKKADCIDFSATSGHWKSAWNFQKEMLLKFVK